MKSKTIFIIAQLDMQRAGNQILFRTVEGYLKKGYKVILLTSNPLSDPNKADYEILFGELIQNLKVYRFTPLLRFLAIPLTKIKNKIFRRKRLSNAKSFRKVEENVPFVKWHHGFVGLISQISFFFGGLFKTINLIKSCRPVAIYGYEIYGAPLAYAMSKVFRIPLITKFQGTIAFPELEKYKFWAWFRIPNHLIGLKIPGNLVIMENDGTRGKEVLLKLAILENKIRFWIDGVDKNMYIPNFDKAQLLKELGLNYETKVILTVSRLKTWKRVDRAILAMPKIIRKFPKAILIVVGDGEEKDNLNKLAKELAVDKNVIFIGAIPHGKVKEYLNACDIFVSLYNHSNLCNPLLEALECGKPVVTINDGSTKEILTNNQNCILIDKEKISEELPANLIRLLSDNNLRETLGRNARNYADRYLLSWEDRMELEVREVEKII